MSWNLLIPAGHARRGRFVQANVGRGRFVQVGTYVGMGSLWEDLSCLLVI